jgi:hypothetical protein
MEVIKSESIDNMFSDAQNQVPIDRLQYPISEANNSSTSDNHRAGIEGGSSSDILDIISQPRINGQTGKSGNHIYSQRILTINSLQFLFLAIYIVFCPSTKKEPYYMKNVD